MKKTIALITTNQVDIGIRIISGVLKASGMETRLINLSSREDYCPLRYPDAVKQALLPIVRDCDVVGISVVDMFFRRAQDLAGWIKAKLEKPVLMGGIHAQLYTEETLSTEGVDGVCIGEGLRSIAELLAKEDWENSSPSDFWLKRKDGSFFQGSILPMVPVSEMDQLPLPDYSYDNYWLLDDRTNEIHSLKDSGGYFHVEQHQIGHEHSFVASFMWGCVNKCNFCNITALSQKWTDECLDNKWYRIKPNSVVFEELKLIKSHNPNMRFMCIMDNDFASRTTRDIRTFFEFFKHEINVPVYLMVSPNTLTESKLEAMVDGGVLEINMGIESNERTNSHIYGRFIKDDVVLEKARMINRYKDRLYPFYDLVIFNPAEDENALLQTIRLIRELPLPFDLVPHHLTLGTETILYKKVVTTGSILPREIERTTTSDYHDFNFDEYATWQTFYLNLLLEWMGGPHNAMQYGRLPRAVSGLRKNAVFAQVLDDARLRSDTEDTLEFLISPPVIDYLSAKREDLRAMHDSLTDLIFTNQVGGRNVVSG